MKNCTILLILFFLTKSVYAQEEKYTDVFKIFLEHYNVSNYDSIFNSFSPEMQGALSKDQTNQFLSGLKAQAGNIIEGNFVKFENGTVGVFKTQFEKATLSVNISIDEKTKINGLLVKPFVEESKSKVAKALIDYPETIGNKIYKQTNAFPEKSQLSIALIKNGEVNYYGVIVENDSLKPIQNQSRVFEIGSISKVFTASVLASLVIEDKLNLNDPINQYYSFAFNNDVNISFLDLANHTAGLSRLPENLEINDQLNPYKNYREKELNDYLEKELKIDSNSEKTYNYSNLGAGLLGHTLGLSEQQTFVELLRKQIFEKYQMRNSFSSPLEIENNLVRGLGQNGQEVPNWEFDVLFGGGGILSTVEDLAMFAQAQFDPENKAFALTRNPTFEINQNMKIGLGWHILKDETDSNLIWHNGGTGGYSSSMALDTKRKNGVIILSNVSAFNPKMGNIDSLCFELMKLTENQ